MLYMPSYTAVQLTTTMDQTNSMLNQSINQSINQLVSVNQRLDWKCQVFGLSLMSKLNNGLTLQTLLKLTSPNVIVFCFCNHSSFIHVVTKNERGCAEEVPFRLLQKLVAINIICGNVFDQLTFYTYKIFYQ